MGRTTTRSVSRLLVVATIAASALLAFPGSAWASDRTHAAEEVAFTDKINASRRDRGLKPLALNLQLTGVARHWSDQMAADRGISHNPRIALQVEGDWTRLGENVGFSSSSESSPAQFVDRLHTAFMQSPGHRANVLGDFNQVGVGVRMTGHTMWVTVNFMKSDTIASNRRVKRAAADAEGTFVEPDKTGRHAAFAVVAASDERAHARGAAALAGKKAPVLYTHPADSWDESPVLHPRTRAAIDRTLGGSGLIYVVGGEKDVSPKAVRELTNDGYTVKRLNATSDPATLVRVARETVRRHGNTERVVITGRGSRKFAAAGSRWAAETGASFLVTDSERLHPAVKDFLSTYRPDKRWVVGDTKAVSGRVKRAADARRITSTSL